MENKKKPILSKVLEVFGYILIVCSILQFILYFASPVANGTLTVDQLFQSVNFITVLSALITYLLATFSGFVLVALGRIIFVISAKYLPEKEVLIIKNDQPESTETK